MFLIEAFLIKPDCSFDKEIKKILSNCSSQPLRCAILKLSQGQLTSVPNQLSEKEKRIGWLRLVRPGLIDTDDPEKLKPDAHLALQAKLLGGYFLKSLKLIYSVSF